MDIILLLLLSQLICLYHAATITTIAGSSTSGSYSGDGGQATVATLSAPSGVAIDTSGKIYIKLLYYDDLFYYTSGYTGNFYITDYNNFRIRKVTVSTGIITTIAGTGTSSFSGDGGQATSATMNTVNGLAVDSSGMKMYFILHFLLCILTDTICKGNVYFADTYNYRVRKITKSTGIISTVAGNGAVIYNYNVSGDGGAATSCGMNSPFSVALDSSGSSFFIFAFISFLILSFR